MSRHDPLSLAFAALADPTRRAILERLASGEAGVVELADASTLTQPAITKHLKVLERAGLIGRAATASAARRGFSSRACSRWTTGCAAPTPNGPTALTASRPISPPKQKQPPLEENPNA